MQIRILREAKLERHTDSEVDKEKRRVIRILTALGKKTGVEVLFVCPLNILTIV